MTERRQRFEGWIAGVGTGSGTRLVLGHWERSPFGAFSDVMVEEADGRRTLLAPTAEVAAYVAATYRFEEVAVVPVRVTAAGPRWQVAAGPLRLAFTTGSRTLLGLLLRAVPVPLGRLPAWAALLDGPARLLPGVRTRGARAAAGASGTAPTTCGGSPPCARPGKAGSWGRSRPWRRRSPSGSAPHRAGPRWSG